MWNFNIVAVGGDRREVGGDHFSDDANISPYSFDNYRIASIESFATIGGIARCSDRLPHSSSYAVPSNSSDVLSTH